MAYNYTAESQVGDNWLDSYRDLSRIIGINCLAYPSISVSKLLQQKAIERIMASGASQSKKWVAVQAGVWDKHGFKQWPIKHLVEACKAITEQYDFIPLVIGVKGQESVYHQIKKALSVDSVVLDFVGKTNVGELAAILSVCSVTIANDSGTMHMSAAVGTPTVGLYGMTNPNITWCYGENDPHRIIQREDIFPCYQLKSNLEEECIDKPCLNGISPSTVVREVIKLSQKKRVYQAVG